MDQQKLAGEVGTLLNEMAMDAQGAIALFEGQMAAGALRGKQMFSELKEQAKASANPSMAMRNILVEYGFAHMYCATLLLNVIRFGMNQPKAAELIEATVKDAAEEAHAFVEKSIRASEWAQSGKEGDSEVWERDEGHYALLVHNAHEPWSFEVLDCEGDDEGKIVESVGHYATREDAQKAADNVVKLRLNAEAAKRQGTQS